MTESGSSLSEQSWSFALQVYSEPGVADACLRLQGEAGVDVMMLLTAAFAAVRLGVVLSPSDIKDMDDVCRPWREQIVRPLRATRVALKSWPSPSPVTEELRSQIKASELAAERLQNDVLAVWLQKKAPTSRAVTPSQLRDALRSIVMDASDGSEHGQIAELWSAVDCIVEAAGRL
jgi:uncharacterized protein (TIGR02444 family)